jgi:hypothetical protein
MAHGKEVTHDAFNNELLVNTYLITFNEDDILLFFLTPKWSAERVKVRKIHLLLRLVFHKL